MSSPCLKAPEASTVRVIPHRVGRGASTRSIRRVFLFEKRSGLIVELQTAYLDHEFGLNSLNAQIAVLRDLCFFETWCALKTKQDKNWRHPTIRAAADQIPLTLREVKDYARWCQRNARSLHKQVRVGTSNVTYLPAADVVKTEFRNRRLRNTVLYLRWLATSLSASNDEENDRATLTEVRCRQLEHWFDKQLLSDRKPAPPRSLGAAESQALRRLLRDKAVFPDTAIGMRDRLVLELLDQGLRPGELLKIQVRDVDDAYALDLGKTIGVVAISRRPNDIDDERLHEPSVKTSPGMLPVPQRLASALIEYVTQHRRTAIDRRADGMETPYLLVNHEGKHVGRPLSQRNLTRVVAKLKGRYGLPETLTPHTLRHTHFTELYDRLRQQGRSDRDIRAILVERGRWAPNSTMPARYTSRSLIRESAAFVEARDREMQSE